MTLTIEDDRAMDELHDAVVAVDGVAAARISCEMVARNKRALVRRVCMRTAHLADARFCEAIIEALSGGAAGDRGRRRGAGAPDDPLADVLATIMAGARALDARDRPRDPPKVASPRQALAPALAAADACAVANVAKLPARLGPTWAGVVSLVVRAHAGDVPQTALVHNERLATLFRTGRAPAGAGARADEDFRLAAIWAYTRHPVIAAAPPAGPRPLGDAATRRVRAAEPAPADAAPPLLVFREGFADGA